MHIPKMSKTIFYVYAKDAKTKPSIPAGYAKQYCKYLLIYFSNSELTKFENDGRIRNHMANN